MTNKEAITVLVEIREDYSGEGETLVNSREALDLAIKALEERPTGEWIPVKYRPLTVDETIALAEYRGIGYSDAREEKAFDCPMPEDGQEVLISTRWGVMEDIACNDMDGEGFFCFGLENNGDWDGVDAWMPLPEPYVKGGEENEQS